MNEILAARTRQPITLALLVTCATAKVNWNLETSFLMSLQQAENNADEFIFDDDFRNNRHLYPTWVSDMTCSTQCVDIHQNEEFCVATSVCQHAKWHHSFLKHQTINQDELSDFNHLVSTTHCDVWGEANRCDGTLCGSDFECQSGCCGAFVSFTHERCLPVLGDYCAGRDKTREGYIDPLHQDIDYSDQVLEPPKKKQPQAKLKEPQAMLKEPGAADFDNKEEVEDKYYDIHHDPHAHIPEVEEKQHEMILNLEANSMENAAITSLNPSANELMDNGRRKDKRSGRK